jgi:hypothetical protein
MKTLKSEYQNTLVFSLRFNSSEKKSTLSSVPVCFFIEEKARAYFASMDVSVSRGLLRKTK